MDFSVLATIPKSLVNKDERQEWENVTTSTSLSECLRKCQSQSAAAAGDDEDFPAEIEEVTRVSFWERRVLRLGLRDGLLDLSGRCCGGEVASARRKRNGKESWAGGGEGAKTEERER